MSRNQNLSFKGSHTTVEPIRDQKDIETINALVKSWCRAVNLQGNYGAHTLRKTFRYIQRTQYGVGFEVLT